jgi:hypothetical protein
VGMAPPRFGRVDGQIGTGGSETTSGDTGTGGVGREEGTSWEVAARQVGSLSMAVAGPVASILNTRHTAGQPAGPILSSAGGIFKPDFAMAGPSHC